MSTVPSIYSRLFRYRARLGREPLEDFLTEALADLLTRMPQRDVLSFLNWAFEDAEIKPDWAWLCGKELKWETQRWVEGGITDIVLSADDKPVLVIENKTWSGLQDHSTEAKEANQITTYCKWLETEAKANGNGPRGMLLITGTTAEPLGYLGQGDYDVASRAKRTWGSLARWLKKDLAMQGSHATWHALARDLIPFLQENDLYRDIIELADIDDVARLIKGKEGGPADAWLPNIKRWQATFSTMWEPSIQIGEPSTETRQQFWSDRINHIVFKAEFGMLWEYRYASDKRFSDRRYIGLGVRFPEYPSQLDGAGLPDRPHFFALLLSDRGQLVTQGPLPPGWLNIEGGFASACEVDRFSLDADTRLDQVNAWASRVMAKAQEILTCSVLAG